jgi:glycosyltransferase involved in cell wall biosynthesis
LSLKCSVIIPTYNGADRIAGTLAALSKQSLIPDEVIVIIDGSTDHTQKVVSKFYTELDTLKIIVQSNKGRAAARNRGALEAKGDILIFYDDDITPQSDSVQLHVSMHSKNKNVIIAGQQIDLQDHNATEFQKFKSYLSTQWQLKKTDTNNNLNTQSEVFLTAANMSVKSNTFFFLEGFNSLTTDIEDFELSLRAKEKGIKIIEDISNIGWHKEKGSFRDYINRQREYRNEISRLVKIGIIPESYSIIKSIHSNIIKRMIYRLFSFAFLIELMEKEFFVFLPQSMRYKLYDLIVTSLGKVYVKVKI